MLIACPECTREVSDRAPACPTCGFPIAEHLREQAAQTAIASERTSRRALERDTDCRRCEARGFYMLEHKDDAGKVSQGFAWCEICGHTGRVALCSSDAGFFAVRRTVIEAFVAGTVDAGTEDVVALGAEEPDARYGTPTE